MAAPGTVEANNLSHLVPDALVLSLFKNKLKATVKIVCDICHPRRLLILFCARLGKENSCKHVCTYCCVPLWSKAAWCSGFARAPSTPKLAEAQKDMVRI